MFMKYRMSPPKLSPPDDDEDRNEDELRTMTTSTTTLSAVPVDSTHSAEFPRVFMTSEIGVDGLPCQSGDEG